MSEFTISGAFLLGGIAAGFIFQRSRLCFVSALRDLYLFRATGMTRAILLLLLALATGGAYLAWFGLAPDLHPSPQPATLMVGGLLFGLGMTLAGSCAAGSLWRLGEGQTSQLWILMGIVGGTWIYVQIPVPTALQTTGVTPWAPPVGLAAALAALLWWERRQTLAGEELPGAEPVRHWRDPWPGEIGALLLAFLLTSFVAWTGRHWAVTRGFLLQDDSALLFSLGLLLGGFLSARLFREWRYRASGPWPARLLRLAGGLLMGYGARIGWGCTVGAVMSGVVTLSLQPWLWLVGASAGAWLGTILLRRFFSLSSQV